MRVLWQCESDEYCRRVLARHWPGVPCHSDVRALRGADVEPVDVLCGGFPCQDISLAGRGAGIDGERSGLWAQFARLIRELRPRYVIVENVPALLARGMGRVLGDLAACGYDAEWDCLPACAFGAPHRRDRVWIVAYPDGGGWDGRPGKPGAGGRREPANGGGAVADADDAGCAQRRWPEPAGAQFAAVERGGEDVADAEGERREPRSRAGQPVWAGEAPVEPQGRFAALTGGCWGAGPWGAEPDVGRVAVGVPARVDRLRALGNALVPQIAEWIGRRVIDAEAR
jgi:DNA (cytosine-5)-methyltransferase 1